MPDDFGFLDAEVERRIKEQMGPPLNPRPIKQEKNPMPPELMTEEELEAEIDKLK